MRDHAARSAGDEQELAALFACEVSYAQRAGAEGVYGVLRSTSPWREGKELIPFEGFEYEPQSGSVVQRTNDGPGPVERRFRIDTLERRFIGRYATEVDTATQAWLDREADTLLRRARRG